jgi:hypothetical protein
MGADQEARDDVAEHDGLAQALEEHRGEARHQHHGGQVLDENDAVHACPCVYEGTG